MYCKLIQEKYGPTLRRPAGWIASTLTCWIGSYDTGLVLMGKAHRISVVVKTKSESIEVAEKWFNAYLIRKYKRTQTNVLL